MRFVGLFLIALSVGCLGGDDDGSGGRADASPDDNADASSAVIDAGVPGDIRVTQNGAEIPADTGSFDFGALPAGLIGARFAFTIENTGEGDLAISSIDVGGADAALFDLDAAGVGTLAPGAFATFTVGFAPDVAGARTATVTIASDDPDEASYAFGLTGTGVAQEDLDPDTNGDFEDTDYINYNTIESRIVVRVGDIDNLGFGFPAGFDPFTGASTPSHGFPFSPEADDPAGTDRIMVVSSYVGTPPAGQDGYTGTTSRPDNLPQPVTLTYDLLGSVPSSAVLQIFVDDFQAPVWQADYEVTLNGTRAPFIEQVISSLVQTGPIGKLITLPVPPEFVDLIATGELEILIDDTTTGAGDGFALDFVKLFIDVYGFQNTGTINGTVTDSSTGMPIENATVSASGFVEAVTDATGAYSLVDAPAGFVFVQTTAPGYQPDQRLVDLATDATVVVNVALAPE